MKEWLKWGLAMAAFLMLSVAASPEATRAECGALCEDSNGPCNDSANEDWCYTLCIEGRCSCTDEEDFEQCQMHHLAATASGVFTTDDVAVRMSDNIEEICPVIEALGKVSVLAGRRPAPERFGL